MKVEVLKAVGERRTVTGTTVVRRSSILGYLLCSSIRFTILTKRMIEGRSRSGRPTRNTWML